MGVGGLQGVAAAIAYTVQYMADTASSLPAFLFLLMGKAIPTNAGTFPAQAFLTIGSPPISWQERSVGSLCGTWLCPEDVSHS